MDLSYIIPPVDRDLIKRELKQKHFLRKTNRGNKEIYITTAHLSPNIMREIGRLRELSYASEGGGSGNEIDIDEFDTMPDPYCCKQLFVWSPQDEEIVGGYRFIHGSNAMRRADGGIMTPTAQNFIFSEHFVNDYLPYTVELGRAFVQPAFQPTQNLGKGLYSLDNLWDGLGVLALEIPETLYFIGKVTLYNSMDTLARDMILYFYQKYFPDRDGLLWPFNPLLIESDYNELVRLFSGRNYKEDYQILQHSVRARGCTLPALVNAYMNLSSSMRYFGACVDHTLPLTSDIGILIPISDINEEKRSRHMESFISRNPKFDSRRLFRIDMKRLPWWRHSSEEEAESLRELSELKGRQRLREQLREKSKELQLELKNISKVRRKLKKDNRDED